MLTKLRHPISAVFRRASIVDQQEPSSTSEHPRGLAQASLMSASWHHMQHCRDRDDIEPSVVERQRGRVGLLKRDTEAMTLGLALGRCEHVRRNVDADNGASRSCPADRLDRLGCRAASHVQDMMTGGNACEIEHLLAIGSFTPAGKDEQQQVVEAREPNAAGGFCTVGRIPFRCGWPSRSVQTKGPDADRRGGARPC